AEGAGLRGEIAAPSAGPLTLDVVDANGNRVRRLGLEGTATGAATLDWDGRDETGKPVAAGTYTFRAGAGTGDPSAPGSELLGVRAAARVDSVSIEPGGLFLNLAGMGSVPLSAIHRIG